MKLFDRLRKPEFRAVATAISAIPATEGAKTTEISAQSSKIAEIAVASLTDRKAANDFQRLDLEPLDVTNKAADRFTAQLALFTAHGLSQRYADAVAHQLARRDLVRDDRRLCLECKYLFGGTTARHCGKWQALGLSSAAIPSDTVDLLRRCKSFDDRLEGMA